MDISQISIKLDGQGSYTNASQEAEVSTLP